MMQASDPVWESGLRTVGILGGVGAGKSTAARALTEVLSGPDCLVDADQEVGLLLGNPVVAEDVAASLGSGVLRPDGLLDRRAMAAQIFADEQARETLEGILHPAVRRAIHRRLVATEASGEARWVILDIPLLIERGLADICDFLIFVDVPDDIRAERAANRHGWSRQEWQAREAAQADLGEKKSRADAILSNADGYEALRTQVQGLLSRIRALPPRSLASRWPRWDQAPLP
ncbi:MAG: dephospho-CoA kinase [Planctomycetes bacterium]|nr:dephospho-CoA kinase [Planctomycetota bacterium]